MKKLREFFKKNYAAVVAAVLGLLGFSVASCDAVITNEPTNEYGCPHADFVISGRVTATENSTAIEGIQVVSENYRDTVYTDENGVYHISDQSVFPPDSVSIIFTDIDGESNGGEFSSKTETVRFQRSDFKGGDGSWYKGKAEKELNVELKKK